MSINWKRDFDEAKSYLKFPNIIIFCLVVAVITLSFGPEKEVPLVDCAKNTTWTTEWHGIYYTSTECWLNIEAGTIAINYKQK